MSQSLHETLLKVFQTIETNVKSGGVATIGIPTGFPSLDKALSGYRQKSVYVIAGRPGTGKTSFGLSTLLAQALLGYKVLVVSLEMPAELLALRMIAMFTGVPSDRIERGQLNADELKSVRTMMEVMENINFRIADKSIDSETFLNGLEDYKNKYELDCLMVDYLSLFRDPNKFGDHERLSRVSANMLEASRRCDIPVLSLAQLNREVEKRENHTPILSDIRDSGSIEQDAFAVLMCYRPHYYEMMFDGAAPLDVETDARIIIAKNRQGETGHVTLNYHPKQTLWTPKEVLEVRPPPSLTKTHEEEKKEEKKSWVKKAQETR